VQSSHAVIRFTRGSSAYQGRFIQNARSDSCVSFQETMLARPTSIAAFDGRPGHWLRCAFQRRYRDWGGYDVRAITDIHGNRA
jgi:hypothetical protein